MFVLMYKKIGSLTLEIQFGFVGNNYKVKDDDETVLARSLKTNINYKFTKYFIGKPKNFRFYNTFNYFKEVDLVKVEDLYVFLHN